MWGREGFVKIEVQNVDAYITGAEHAQQGIHIGTIAIDQATGFVDNIDYFADVFIKQTQRVGVGKHHPSQVFIAELFQSCDVNITTSVRW